MEKENNHSTIKYSDTRIRKLETLLMESTRVLMFSEFLLYPEGVSPKELAYYTKKDRTTINFHLRKFIDQD